MDPPLVQYRNTIIGIIEVTDTAPIKNALNLVFGARTAKLISVLPRLIFSSGYGPEALKSTTKVELRNTRAKLVVLDANQTFERS